MAYADLIIENGKLLTFAPGAQKAEALALRDGKIQAVGSNADISSLRGNSTQVIDAQGNTVLPGLIESHIHLFSGGYELGLLNLAFCHGEAELTAKARAYSSANPNLELLYAIGADYELMGEGQTIDRHGLDRVVPNRPFAVLAADHHTVWANTRALEMAGILRGGDVPVGSRITMGADGMATGELLESGAYELVLARTALGGRDMLGMTTGADPVPPPTAAQRAMDKAALKAGLNHLAAHGITTFHNMDGNFYQLELLAEIEADGDLLCRGQVPFHLKNFDSLDRLEEADDMRRRYNSHKLWSGRLKLFHDGVIESGTAAMLAPYPNWPDTSGAPLFEPDFYREIISRADAMGLQISVHAIGDAAVRETLDAYQNARAVNGTSDSRHRIEHIEVIHADDLSRLVELDVIASMQPLHAPNAGTFPPPPPGAIFHEDQKPLAYPWGPMRDTGARLIFNSDWPVVDVNPMASIRGAVAPADLGTPWHHQPQSLMDALKSYTSDAAFTEFSEAIKGQLVAGMFGDVTILDANIEAMALEDVGDVKVAATICGGRLTFEKS